MSGHYKLIIQNHKKSLLKEDLMQYSFKQHVLPVFQDLFKTSTNIIRATIISVGATVEYQIISSNVKGFASLNNINKKFQEKIEEADKLYKDAVPESVRGDVNLLYNMSNPGAFIAQRLINSSVDDKGLESYIPFYWFTKYFLKGKGGFFETDVEKFGDLFGLKFNNIIWYKGFIYKELIGDSVDWFTTDGIELLSKTNIQELKDIKTIEDLQAKYWQVALFFKAYKIFQLYTAPVVEYYDFCKQYSAEKLLQICKLFAEYASAELKEENADNALAEFVGAHPTCLNAGDPKYNEFLTLAAARDAARLEMNTKKKEFTEESKDLLDTLKTKMEIIFRSEMELLPNIFGLFPGATEVIQPYLTNLLIAGLNVSLSGINEVFSAMGLPQWFRFTSGFGGAPAPVTPSQPQNNDARLVIKNNQKFLTEASQMDVSTLKVKKKQEESVYKLQINNARKFLIEEPVSKEQKKIETEKKSRTVDDDDLNELEQLGLNSYKPNVAEELIIKNLLEDEKIGKYGKQWLEFVKVANQLTDKGRDKKKEIFRQMMTFSLKYFDNINNELQGAFEDLKNDQQSEVSQKINSELKKEYNFEMTPQGFAKKLSYDFELLCNINTIYVGSYLINIEFVFEKNQVIYLFLKDSDIENTRLLINNLKNNINKKLMMNEDLIKKFDKLSKETIKIFGEKSRTVELFEKAQKELYVSIEKNRQAIIDFCDDFHNVLNDFEKLSPFDKMNKLKDMITEYDETLQVNFEQIYNEFLPALKKLKDNFNINLKNKKDDFKKNFDGLLMQMDLQSFDKIYSDKKLKFEEKYNNCIKYTGLSKEGSKLFENLNELKAIQQQYQEKIKNATGSNINNDVQQQNQTTTTDTDDVKNNSEKNVTANMQKDDTKIKIKTNDINPIGVDSDDEEEVKEEF